MKTKKINERLEYLRRELRAERISYGELAELQSLARYIDPGDVELLEAAGVPEFQDDKPPARRKPNLFLDNGAPRYIRCYDNGGQSFDRYTIVFTRLRRFYPYAASSALPFSPLGFYQHGEGTDGPIDRPAYSHLGKPVEFLDLPEDVQKAVRSDYNEYHNIKP